jgi:hypothetical protein
VRRREKTAFLSKLVGTMGAWVSECRMIQILSKWHVRFPVTPEQVSGAR